MAKETKAQRTAREAVVREAMMEEARLTYPARLLAVLERAQDANFELRVRDAMYTLYDRDERRPETVVLAPWYSDINDQTLERFQWDVEFKEDAENAEKEANRKQAARQAALSKLTAEERELLSL